MLYMGLIYTPGHFPVEEIKCLSKKSYIICGFSLNNVRSQWLVVTPVTEFLHRLFLHMESISNPAKRGRSTPPKLILEDSAQ